MEVERDRLSWLNPTYEMISTRMWSEIRESKSLFVFIVNESWEYLEAGTHRFQIFRKIFRKFPINAT